MSNQKLALEKPLIFLGYIPFAICAFCKIIGISKISYFGEIEEILVIYSIIIISFMSGSHWGISIKINNENLKTALLLTSNAIAVLIFFVYLILEFKQQMLSFALFFILLLFIDYKLLLHQKITKQYFKLRCIITTLVICALIISVIT